MDGPHFFFWPCHTACRILLFGPGIEPGSLSVKGPSPNHRTPREFPGPHFTEPSSVDGHLGCFHSGAVVNNTAGTFVYRFLCARFISLGVTSPGQMVAPCQCPQFLLLLIHSHRVHCKVKTWAPCSKMIKTLKARTAEHSTKPRVPLSAGSYCNMDSLMFCRRLSGAPP